MNAYIIEEDYEIIRNAGDYPAPIVIIVPDSLDLSEYDTAMFYIYSGGLNCSRTCNSTDETTLLTIEGVITITQEEQKITISFAEGDTTDLSGDYK